MRVVIVEDDATIAGFVARGLAQEGFTVDTAHDGRTAFTMATAEHFDLAIVDPMLPEIGIEDSRARPVYVQSSRQREGGVDQRLL